MNNTDKLIFTPLERKKVEFTPFDRKSYPYTTFHNEEEVIRYTQESVNKAKQKSMNASSTMISSHIKPSRKINVQAITKRIVATALVASGITAVISGLVPLVKKTVIINEEKNRVEAKLESQGFDIDQKSDIDYGKMSIEEDDLYGAYLCDLDFNELAKNLGYESSSDYLIKNGMVEVYESGISHPSTKVWENYEEARLLKEKNQEREEQNGKSR